MSGMAAGGALGAISSIWNANTGQQAANQASQQQVGADVNGLTGAQNIYNQSASNFSPYIQNGAKAEGQLGSLAGPNGALGRQFTQTDFQQDPAYQFDVQQGLAAIANSNSVRGGALSGGALKAASNYGQQQASNEYQNAYSRFTQNQNQNFNQLSSMAGQGLQGSQALGQLGGQFSNLQSNIWGNIGTAQAAGTLGAAQAQETGTTGAFQGLGSMMKQ